MGFGVYTNPGKVAFFKLIHPEERLRIFWSFQFQWKRQLASRKRKVEPTKYFYVFRETRLRVTGASCATLRTGLWATHGVLAGYLVLVGTASVTPA